MLTMDSVVRVNLTIGASVAVNSTFSTGAILGSTVLSSNPITSAERFRVFTSLEAVAEAGFATTAPEYVAARKYFGVANKPEKVVIIYYSAVENSTENPVDALADAVDKGADYYGVYYCAPANVSDSVMKTTLTSIAEYLGTTYKCGALFYGVTGTVASVTANTGILAAMHELEHVESRRRAFGLVCAEDVSDAASMMGLAMGYATAHRTDAFALIYKPMALATVRNLTQAEVNSIKNLNGNVYVQRTSTVSCLENGSSAEGMRFDELLYLDRIAFDLQTACFELIANNETKLLQNDTTSELFISEINRILEDYYNGGVLATETWTGPSFGNVVTGATLEHGYTAYADSYDLQSEEDRAARKAMPITVLLTMSGAVESVVLNLYVVE